MASMPSFVRVVDIETTGLDPATDEIIEIGWVDVFTDGFIGPPYQVFVQSKHPVTVEARATHHITDAEIESGVSIDVIKEHIFTGDPVAFVAHNSSFEASFMPWQTKPWIDTYRCALRLYPDAPRHTNQVLRYLLELELDNGLAMPPHRAAPDAYVTAHIFARMLANEGENRLKRLAAWSKLPGLLPRINFGKHLGASWSDVPEDYLEWIIRQVDMDQDRKYTASVALENRRSELSKTTDQGGLL